MKIFLICPVRNMTEEQREKIEILIKTLEENGHQVHYPVKNTNQSDERGYGFYICDENLQAIKNADEVFIWYDAKSQGSHFDLGVAFSLKKKIKLINPDCIDRTLTKSFPQMLEYWEYNGGNLKSL